MVPFIEEIGREDASYTITNSELHPGAWLHAHLPRGLFMSAFIVDTVTAAITFNYLVLILISVSISVVC